MNVERLEMSIQTTKENIAILESQQPEDVGHYLQLEHEKMVLDALEKQVPKRPINTSLETVCPICKYDISMCQCMFGGNAHPDRSKRREVVIDHLYLFSPKQIEHIIDLQRIWQMSYGDDEKNRIFEELKGGAEL